MTETMYISFREREFQLTLVHYQSDLEAGVWQYRCELVEVDEKGEFTEYATELDGFASLAEAASTAVDTLVFDVEHEE